MSQNRRLRLPLRREHLPHRRLWNGWREAAATIPGVAYATDYKYMCSDPGQNLSEEGGRRANLTGLVVAACSPRMHEKTFRNAAEAAGLNPYLCEMANIREHCSWVHEDREEATAKAIDIVRTDGRAGQEEQEARSRSPSRSPSGRWSSAAASPASRRRSTSPTAATR